MQIKAVEESRVSRKTRCGIISFVHNFEVSFYNSFKNKFKFWSVHGIMNTLGLLQSK